MKGLISVLYGPASVGFAAAAGWNGVRNVVVY